MHREEDKSGRLNQLLKELHLPTVRRCYQDEAISARRDNWDYETYLYELATRESEVRHNNRIARLQRESKLPLEKSLKAFDRKRLPRKVDAQLNLLLKGDFLDHKENVLAFGHPGSGKTHLLCAIAQELTHQGRQVRFIPCSLLVQELLIAKRDLKLARVLKQYAKYEALIIDDIGYVQQSREEMEVLFTLLADRYERSSIMLTSNLPFSKWEQIFKDPMTTAAAIDRLVHHSVILELNIPSYRLEQSQKSKETVAVQPAQAELQEQKTAD
jgi:DNA replication protein DnaC